jgi:hypothetical protein
MKGETTITCTPHLEDIDIRGRIRKFPDWIDNEINNDNKHSLRSDTKSYGGKTHYIDSQNSDITVPNGRELYHLKFLLQAASPETFGYTLVDMRLILEIQVLRLGKWIEISEAGFREHCNEWFGGVKAELRTFTWCGKHREPKEVSVATLSSSHEWEK